MKTIETIVYNFDELNDKSKEKAREWFKEGMANETFWSECVIEDSKNIASLLGIEIDKIYFSGFSSQGDGAFFIGKFRASNVKAGEVMKHAPKDEVLHRIAKEFENIALYHPNLYFSTTHNGRYHHENSVYFDFEEINNDKEIRNYELFDDTKDVAKRFMKWIYKQLENAWNYENSNESVDENIRANEYTFTEDGKRFGN